MGKRQTENGAITFVDYRRTLGVELVYGHQVTHAFTRHTHRTVGFGLIEHGIRLYQCQGKSYQVEAGQVFIIPPNCEHVCGSVNDQPHTYCLLLVDSEILQASGLISSRAGCSFKQLVINNGEIYSGMCELRAKLGGAESDLTKKSLLLTVVGNIFEGYGQTMFSEVESNPEVSKAIRKVQNYIETNYAACFSLEDIAQLAHISSYHLLRLFSRIVGIPPHIYQQQVRIRQAKQLLNQGCSILDTAMNTGFADQSHFSKVFKKMVGITPGEYRLRKSILTVQLPLR